MNVKEIIEEVEIFIDENIEEFEFIVDIYDNELYEINFFDNSLEIDECCTVFIREEDDKKIYGQTWTVGKMLQVRSRVTISPVSS